MIKRLGLENFKPIEKLDLELRPITVLCGPNSVGKSSIGQALLMLKQSKQQYGSVSLLRPTGDLVDAGGYPDFIHRHELNRIFSIKVDLDVGRIKAQPRGLLRGVLPEVERFFEYLTNVKALTLELSYSYDSQKEEIMLQQFCIKSPDDKLHIESKTNPDKTYRFIYSLGQKQKRFHTSNPKLQSLGVFFSPFLPAKTLQESISDYKRERISFLHFASNVLIGALNWELNELDYLGPFREPPQRTYMTGGAKPEGIGTRGQLTIDYLAYSSVASTDGVVEFAKQWLDRFGYASDFSIDKVHGLIWMNNLKNKSTGVSSTLLDVGFGISQVLPVIVTVYLHKRGLHIFEQPEIHLHPASQADLADLFIETIAEDKQYLVETHSEHFLNRVRTRIAQGKIDPQMVSVLYMKYRGSDLKVDPIFISENGSFKDIPDDFFGEALAETRAIMDARRQRRLL